MERTFDNLPKKFKICMGNLKYRNGDLNLIYSVEPRKLVAKVSRYQQDKEFTTKLGIHEERIAKKLNQKGYWVPEIEGVYCVYDEDKKIYVPSFVMEDKYKLVLLSAVPLIDYNYFNDYYAEIQKSLEKDKFDYGDVNEQNCLCDLNKRKICLLDFNDWEYFGKKENILSPIRY